METTFTKGFFVAAIQRQLGQRCVGGLLLAKNFFQEVGGFAVAQNFSPFVQRTVGSDFVMFHFLGG